MAKKKSSRYSPTQLFTSSLFLIVGISVIAMIVLVMSFNLSSLRNADAARKTVAPGQYKRTANLMFGDCNLDQKIDAGDISALNLEISDGDGDSAQDANLGKFKGEISCDANYDNKINITDQTCINRKIFEGSEACDEFATKASIPGDCNGDTLVDAADLSALTLELNDDDGTHILHARNGAFEGYRGCDANLDLIVDKSDTECTGNLIFGRSCE